MVTGDKVLAAFRQVSIPVVTSNKEMVGVRRQVDIPVDSSHKEFGCLETSKYSHGY